MTKQDGDCLPATIDILPKSGSSLTNDWIRAQWFGALNFNEILGGHYDILRWNWWNIQLQGIQVLTTQSCCDFALTTFGMSLMGRIPVSVRHPDFCSWTTYFPLQQQTLTQRHFCDVWGLKIRQRCLSTWRPFLWGLNRSISTGRGTEPHPRDLSVLPEISRVVDEWGATRKTKSLGARTWESQKILGWRSNHQNPGSWTKKRWQQKGSQEPRDDISQIFPILWT